MAQLLTTFDPTNPTSGTFVASFNTGKGTLHVKNASPVDVGFSLDQSGYVQYVVQAGEPRDIPVPKSRMTVYWSQQNKLNTNSKQIQSVVYVESYECNESIPASQALARHVNNVNIGYSLSWNGVVAAGAAIGLNIFNPANSGVNATFYSAPFVTNDAATGFGNLFYFVGVDNNLDTPVTPQSHIIGGPASKMHATASIATSFAGGFTTLSRLQTNANLTDYIPYPDQILVPPGTNFGIFGNAANASFVQEKLKWTETPV